jgi:hypothetical protein
MDLEELSPKRPIWEAALEAARQGQNEEVSGKGYLSPVFSVA